jgi:hypothetical protein
MGEQLWLTLSTNIFMSKCQFKDNNVIDGSGDTIQATNSLYTLII